MAEWTKEHPTEPGWWWYEDALYGPSPVHIDWSGTHSAALVVDSAMSEDIGIIYKVVTWLEGNWYPIEEPERQHNEWEESQLS